eukprot:scaffold14000_cov135-Isochrysis_galbana.AAC.7
MSTDTRLMCPARRLLSWSPRNASLRCSRRSTRRPGKPHGRIAKRRVYPYSPSFPVLRWFVRDELRVQAYNMRSSMLAINKVLPESKKVRARSMIVVGEKKQLFMTSVLFMQELASQAYKKYWSEVEAFDLACAKKEPALANKEYADVLAALKSYTDLV